MDEWVDGWMDGWMDWGVGGWVGGCLVRLMSGHFLLSLSTILEELFTISYVLTNLLSRTLFHFCNMHSKLFGKLL